MLRFAGVDIWKSKVMRPPFSGIALGLLILLQNGCAAGLLPSRSISAAECQRVSSTRPPPVDREGALGVLRREAVRASCASPEVSARIIEGYPRWATDITCPMHLGRSCVPELAERLEQDLFDDTSARLPQLQFARLRALRDLRDATAARVLERVAVLGDGDLATLAGGDLRRGRRLRQIAVRFLGELASSNPLSPPIPSNRVHDIVVPARDRVDQAVLARLLAFHSTSWIAGTYPPEPSSEALRHVRKLWAGVPTLLEREAPTVQHSAAFDDVMTRLRLAGRFGAQAGISDQAAPVLRSIALRHGQCSLTTDDVGRQQDLLVQALQTRLLLRSGNEVQPFYFSTRSPFAEREREHAHRDGDRALGRIDGAEREARVSALFGEMDATHNEHLRCELAEALEPWATRSNAGSIRQRLERHLFRRRSFVVNDASLLLTSDVSEVATLDLAQAA